MHIFSLLIFVTIYSCGLAVPMPPQNITTNVAKPISNITAPILAPNSSFNSAPKDEILLKSVNISSIVQNVTSPVPLKPVSTIAFEPQIATNEADKKVVNATTPKPVEDKPTAAKTEAPKTAEPQPAPPQTANTGSNNTGKPEPKLPSIDNTMRHGVMKDDASSHFFAFLLTFMILVIILYLVFHNKKRIIALLIEGRNPQSRRDRGRARYHKLDNNLEEAMAVNDDFVY